MPRKHHTAGRRDSSTKRYQQLLDEQRQQIEALGKTFRSELANATRQLEAYVNLVHMLQGHDAVPSLHGWPISPDLAVLLLQQLNTGRYDLVLEFGSGSSTVLLAQHLRQRGLGDTTMPRTRQLAFEHLDAFQAQTLAQLSERGLADHVALFCKPLVPYVAADGASYLYYDCVSVLSASAFAMGSGTSRIFVLVDGPPSATGRHARYPALPLLLAAFPKAQLDVWLDDYIRNDEQEIAQMWLADLRQSGRSFVSQVHRLEKDAFHLRIEPLEESAQPST